MPLLFLLISPSNFFFFSTLLGFVLFFFSAISPDWFLSLLQDFIRLNCRIPFLPTPCTFLQLLCCTLWWHLGRGPDRSFHYFALELGCVGPTIHKWEDRGTLLSLQTRTGTILGAASQAGFSLPLQCSECKHNPSLCSFPFIIKVEDHFLHDVWPDQVNNCKLVWEGPCLKIAFLCTPWVRCHMQCHQRHAVSC